MIKDDAGQFRDRMLSVMGESLGRVVVDASCMSYVDSTGLEVLTELSDVLAKGGRSLKLCGINETLLETIDLTGLSANFDLYEDVNPAVRSFMT